MDRIEVRRILAWGKHGAYPGEKDTEQPFEIDLRLDIDLRPAQSSDDLGDTLDYARLHAAVASIVATTSFDLLEALAGAVLEAAFADPRVSSAQVRIAKPRLLSGATPSVTLQRDNPRYRPAFP